MAASDQLAPRMERMALDTVEAALLVNHIGQEFDAIVISGSKPAEGQRQRQERRQRQRKRQERNGPSGIIQIAEPAVTARCAGELESGTKVRVRLVSSDIATREVQLRAGGLSRGGSGVPRRESRDSRVRTARLKE